MNTLFEKMNQKTVVHLLNKASELVFVPLNIRTDEFNNTEKLYHDNNNFWINI